MDNIEKMIDLEWLLLMAEAKQMGLTIQEVLFFLTDHL
ncbi:DNA-binding anti-repressor SinI [Bacillus sp. JJ722]